MTNSKSASTPEQANDAATEAPVSYTHLMEQAGDTMLQNLVETQNATLAAIKVTLESFAKPIDYSAVTPPSVPSLREVVESNLAFAEKYLSNQREYAQKVLELHGV